MQVTNRQFRRFSELVYRECGINLHDGKQQLLQARLSKRLRKTGIQSVDEYLRVLEKDNEELVHFLDAVSTNHTFFFRENHHFECLEKGHSKIWCAASSSGEEPYSVAMYCMEKGFRPAILATDISTHVLRAGERGIYSGDRAKHVPQPFLKKYFQKGQGRWEGYIRVKEEVRRMVTFRRFNLLTSPPMDQRFDVIFCRNVLIYFDNVVKERVIKRLYDELNWNGYLIIGGAESLNSIHHKCKYIRPSIYQKVRAMRLI